MNIPQDFINKFIFYYIISALNYKSIIQKEYNYSMHCTRNWHFVSNALNKNTQCRYTKILKKAPIIKTVKKLKTDVRVSSRMNYGDT